jgi:uncharacterized protein YprB with RNaseH-like and TPR domain
MSSSGLGAPIAGPVGSLRAPTVLRSTFMHLAGIGPVTEAAFWRAGVHDWDRFRLRRTIPGVSRLRKERWEAELRSGEEALEAERAEHFAARLPPSEHWRLYPAFRPGTAFLDIETTGLSAAASVVTVVTVHGGGATRTFVRGEDLEELPAYLGRFGVLVTFNGTYFDLPFLRTAFPEWVPPAGHIDLRFALHRLGYSGGLKRIELVLGVGDRAGVEGIRGDDAVRLWYQAVRGHPEALRLLVEYNRADTVNLEPLLVFTVRGLARQLARSGLVRPIESFLEGE